MNHYKYNRYKSHNVLEKERDLERFLSLVWLDSSSELYELELELELESVSNPRLNNDQNIFQSSPNVQE